jgi:anti-sigma factor RsiW
MNCKTGRVWILRELDDELSVDEQKQLHAHLTECAFCSREFQLIMLPGRIARSVAGPEPSPYFYSRLKASIESERPPVSLWQIIMGLSRRVVPSFAVVMLAFLAVFTYYHFKNIRTEAYQAYDHIYISGERSPGMVIDNNEITDETVLLALPGDTPVRSNEIEQKK